MTRILYPALGIVVVTCLFFSWVTYRWLRKRRLTRGDDLRSRIKGVLETLSQNDSDLLKSHPREAVNEIFKLLNDYEEEVREALFSYLEVIDFSEELDDLEIREKESDYRLLVVKSALGMEEGWEISVMWLDKPGTWQWSAAIHALSYWPGQSADQLLVAELASLSERYRVVDRAFNQPIIGALKRRGSNCQELAQTYLNSFSPPYLLTLVLMYFKELDRLSGKVRKSLENRLKYLWEDAGDELKAKILSVAAKHGLSGLVPVAREAIGREVDFVQLWAVRLLSKSSEEDSYLKKVREEGSPRARKEVEELPSLS